MDSHKLRDAVYRTPFRPVRLVLEAGEPIEVRHPEHIFVSEAWVGVAQDPGPPIIFEAERVASVSYLKNGRRRKA